MIRIKLFVLVLVLLSIVSLLPGAVSQTPTEYTLLTNEMQGVHSAQPTGTEEISSSGLVLSYNMDNLTGGDMEDFSGNGNHGTIRGSPDSASGLFLEGSEAMAFPDLADDIRTPDGLSIIGPSWTVAGWIRADNAPANAERYGIAGQQYGWYWDHTNSIFDAVAYVDATVGGYQTASFGTLVANTWYLLVATYDNENIRAYRNASLMNTNTVPSGNTLVGTSPGIATDGAASDDCSCVFDDIVIFNRTWSQADVQAFFSRGMEYTFRFDSEPLVPPDLTVGTTWLNGLNITWGAEYDLVDIGDWSGNISLTANASIWFEGGGATTEKVISWDSFTNITGADIGFNFTMPDGTYPYWVNNTFQANLTTVGGEISFNWTDWLDGEHLFELGINFTSTPITTGISGSFYSYPATITKTSVTWFCVLCPPWGSLSAAGVLSGTPIGNGNFPVILQANATGFVTLQQSFTVIISGLPVAPSLTNTGILFIIGFIPFLMMVGIGFWKEQGALIIVGGMTGVLLGLWLIFVLQDFGSAQFFGTVFLSIGVLFSYIGWVNIERGE